MTESEPLRVLIVDDSAQICKFVTEYILKPRHFQIDIAADGVEGLEKVLKVRPDLILLDYEMPRMSGVEVLEMMHRHQVKIPVILMTSHGSEQIAVNVFRLGVKDYVIKPFTVEEMIGAIDQALAMTRLQQEKEALTQRVLRSNQKLEQRVHELNIMYRIGKSITALMNPETMLERVVEAVMFMTNAEEGALVLVEPETGKFKKHLKKRRDPAHNNHRRKKKWHYTDQLNTTALRKKRSITQNVISVPLQVGHKVIGTLSVSKFLDNPFTAHDEQLLQMVADYAAIAIHNLQLMRQLHLTKEQEKKQIRGMFERYVAPSVVEQALAQPGQVKLGGVRQTVTVLFADIRGFSTFSANLSPEILIELLNRYMEAAAEAVLAQEGTLDKFMGDAVMAFFNAPLPQMDHPLRAIQAALALGQNVKQVHKQLIPAYHLHFGVGVGIGEAVVGNVGTSQLMNYTVIGDSVNKVKRLQENAAGGQVLISQETYNLVQNEVRTKCIGDVHLKGQSRPEPVYEVLGFYNERTFA